MRCTDTGALDANAVNVSDRGTTEIVAISPSSASASPSAVSSSTTTGIPALIRGAASRSTQTSACTGPFLATDHHAAYRKAAAISRAAIDEPYREDEQQQGDDGDEQAFPRRGNRQKPVELFAFFLRFGNGIVKRIKGIVKHEWRILLIEIKEPDDFSSYRRKLKEL